MDNVNGEYASVKFTQLDKEPSLQFGEFKVERENGTVWVGSGEFPIDKKEGETNG